jgi:hypothetical protein
MYPIRKQCTLADAVSIRVSYFWGGRQPLTRDMKEQKEDIHREGDWICTN